MKRYTREWVNEERKGGNIKGRKEIKKKKLNREKIKGLKKARVGIESEGNEKRELNREEKCEIKTKMRRKREKEVE